jgi:hypothetical protein
LAGTYDGFVNRLNRADFNDNGSAYTMTWTTPYLHLGNPILTKGFRELFMFMKPQGDYEVTVSYTIDNFSSESLTYSQAGGGATLGAFTLGTDQLGGGALITRSKALVGSGRSIQITCVQDDVDVGSETYGFAIEAIPEQVDYSD